MSLVCVIFIALSILAAKFGKPGILEVNSFLIAEDYSFTL
jgi:hypothetical protein